LKTNHVNAINQIIFYVVESLKAVQLHTWCNCISLDTINSIILFFFVVYHT